MTHARLAISSVSPLNTGIAVDEEEGGDTEAEEGVTPREKTAAAGRILSLNGLGSTRVARRMLWQAVSSKPRVRRQAELSAESKPHKRDSSTEDLSSRMVVVVMVAVVEVEEDTKVDTEVAGA